MGMRRWRGEASDRAAQRARADRQRTADARPEQRAMRTWPACVREQRAFEQRHRGKQRVVQTIAATTSRAALRPRTSHGSIAAASAHTAAPSSSSTVNVGRPRAWRRCQWSSPMPPSAAVRSAARATACACRAATPPAPATRSRARPVRRGRANSSAEPASAGKAPARPARPSAGASPAASQPGPERRGRASSGAPAASTSSDTPGQPGEGLPGGEREQTAEPQSSLGSATRAAHRRDRLRWSSPA